MANKANSRTKNTVLNLVSGLGGEVVIYALSFVTRTIFIQTLGRAYLGIGGLFTNILTLLSLTDMGIGTALNFRFYKPLKENDQSRIRVLLTFYKRVYTLIGAIILALGLCLMPFLKFLIKDYETFNEVGINAAFVFFLYLMQSVSSYWFFAYKSAIVKADQKEYYISILGYALTLATHILQIIVLLTTYNYMLYISVVIFMNIATGFVNAKLAERLYPYIKEPCSDRISKEERKNIFRDCRTIFLFSANSVIMKTTDNLVLSTFIGLDVVGLYSNYLIIYNALKKMVKRFIRSAQASVGNLFSSISGEEKYRFFQQMNILIFSFGGLVSVCVAVLSDEFIRVWLGEEYIIAQPFSVLIAAELYLLGIILLLVQMRDVIGLFQQMKWRPIIGMVSNVVFSILLVQRLGIYGVLLGTIISEIVSAILMDPYVICKYGFENTKYIKEFYFTNLFFVAELVLAGLLCWYLNQHVLVGYGWLSLVVHAIITGVLTAGVIVLFNFKNKAFQAMCSRLSKNVRLGFIKKSQ